MNKKKLRILEVCSLYYFVMRASFLGITSSNVLHLAKQDGWISMILGMLFGLIPLVIFLKIQNRYPNDTIFGITKKILRPMTSKVINLLLSIGVFMCVVVIFYNLISFISSQYLNLTPTLAIAIMFFIAITYILTKGITVIARTHLVLLYFSIILFILAAVGLLQEVSLSNLKPMLEFGFKPVLKGSLSFISFNVLPLFILTCIPKNYIFNNQYFERNIILTYLLGSISLIVTLFFIISVFGPHLALLYQYPEFHLLKLITLGGFITRVEGIIALHWLFDLFAFIVMGIYFVMQYMKEDFSLPDRWATLVMTLVCVGLIFVVEHIFKNNTIANFILLNIAPFISFFLFLLIPLFLWFVSKKRKTTYQ